MESLTLFLPFPFLKEAGQLTWLGRSWLAVIRVQCSPCESRLKELKVVVETQMASVSFSPRFTNLDVR